ncbi:MAG: hypothetical protein OXE78_03170 [Gammaproteobacteria bacterium]|nr:hypothetical protein [Gammaproteobacteria bacterium]
MLVTTHNPAFMDALDESKMGNVYTYHRDESGEGSQVTCLSDIGIADRLAFRGGLGEIVTRSLLEEHIALNFAEIRSKKLENG